MEKPDKDFSEVEKAWAAALALPVNPGERWAHYKGHGDYEIVAVSLREGDFVPLVTYRSLRYGTTWTRTAEEFLGRVNETARFTRVD